MNRRQFIQRMAATSAALSLAGCQALPRVSRVSPNEKLNIGIIGVANRGGANLGGVASENIVALCDIDELYLNQAAQNFPAAKCYRDFRKMLEQNNIDAVVVSTPDHTHAPAANMAMKLGKHVYCEKPLTHNIYEARKLAQTAAKYNLATQMGTQIHEGDNYRRVVELIQSGAIGEVSRVHVWFSGGRTGNGRSNETFDIPKHIDWDLWLGPAPYRPYNPAYHPAQWRDWWDFAGGTLGDFGCHYMDLPFWALKLRHPTTVEATGSEVKPENTAEKLTVHYDFPARDKLPPVKMTWYNGSELPAVLTDHDLPAWSAGVLFMGTKGMLMANYGEHKLFPEDDFADFEPPRKWLPSTIGHHWEWIIACKTGNPTTCNFDYAGALTETVHLGNVSFRLGRKLEWDAKKLIATNCPQANQYIRRKYRKGWKL